VGWPAWLDAQLAPATIDESALTAKLAGLTTLEATNAANKNRTDQTVAEVRHATFVRAVDARRQLYEVMVQFWSDHFNLGSGQWWAFAKATDLRTVARAHALGTFREMLLASARSPAMLLYLDNALSHAGEGINENYGRELLELHTLGIHDGVVPSTEADVRGAATVLAGWGIEWTNYTFTFNPWAASTAAVSILGGAWSRPARSSTSQVQADGVSLLEFLARHPMTARNIARKLCRRFVGDDPPPALVESAAQVYLANDTAIAPVLRHILTSAAFASSPGAKLRRPFELLAAMCRATGADVGPALGTGARRIDAQLAGMGHQVLGWPTPDGYPDRAPRWISSQAVLNRWRTAARLARNGLQATTPAAGQQVSVNLAGLLATGTTCGELVDALAVRLLGRPLSTVERDAVLAGAAVSAGTAATTIRSSSTRSATVVALVLCVPSFQRR